MNSLLILILVILLLGIPFGIAIAVIILGIKSALVTSTLKDKDKFLLKSKERQIQCKEAEAKRNVKQLRRESKWPKIFLRDKWDEATGTFIKPKIIKGKDAIRYRPIEERERTIKNVDTTSADERKLEGTRNIQPTVITNPDRGNDDIKPTKRKFDWS